MIYKIVVVKGMNGGVMHLKTLSLPVNPQRLWSLLVANDNNIKNLYIISALFIKRGVDMKVLSIILLIMASVLMGTFAFFLCWLGDKSDN